jgi:putative Holliday junction resolvase
MRRGRRLGVDFGKVRVGVARCDPDGILATPVATLTRSGRPESAVAREIATLADDDGAIEILIGWPTHLSGQRGPAAVAAEHFAVTLASSWPGPVRLIDERLSTVQAQGALHAAGRSERTSRAVIDQVAAVLILQSALDAERTTGHPPGTLVAPPGPPPSPLGDCG